MAESTIITLPKTMSLGERISEVNKRLSAWTDSLEKSFNNETDSLQMGKCERNHEGYVYQYIVLRQVKGSGEDPSSPERLPEDHN